MDSFLLGNAVQKNGPDLIRYLREEEQQFPENVVHYLTKYKEKPPEVQDPDLKQKICRFVSKKADFLFETPPDNEEKSKKVADNEDTFAKMPPLETFMGIQEVECRKNFFNSIEKRDIVIGVVNSVMESGLVITLLCLDNGKSRDIDHLRISAFCPVKELPKLFPNQDAIEGFQVRDKVRAVVLSVNTETEKLIVSMVERSLPEENSSIKLALINEEEFPVQYRRKLHIRGLTFDELLHSILGFNNSGNIDRLLDILDQQEDSSLMRGLHRVKIPEKDLAENLRKYQSQKMAHSSVAQGITYFKAGKQSEAIQCFNKALDIDKTNVEAFVARGALYANNESFNRAIDDFEDALKINPNHTNARKYLHDTLLAFGKSNEDIEKYKEAEELYGKAMTLEQSSVEAREALRFLHYKKSQKNRPEDTRRKSSPRMERRDSRRKSSPGIERRNQSPEGFEKTAKTLKKLIKGDDRRHRKRSRKMSSESASSSDSSSSRSRSRSPDRNRKRRDSKSRDRGQRNRSPPSGRREQQPAPEEEEALPHQQYGVDLQSSFLAGGGASFSEIFRSSSQESETPQEQQISTQVTSVPVHYGTDPYMYANPHAANWYGTFIPGLEPTAMYGYGVPFTGIEQGYPGAAPQAFYPGNQIPFLDMGRRKSRSVSRGRSESDRSSRSSSFESKDDTDNRQDRRSDKRRRENRDAARSNSPKYSRKSKENKERKSIDGRKTSREERSPSLDRSRRSWSESSFEDSKNTSMTTRKNSPDRIRRSLSQSSANGRIKAEDKNNRTSEKEGSSRNSLEKVSKEIKDVSKTTVKVSGNKKSTKKKKEADGETSKTKKKKKVDGENKKKTKKNSGKSDIQNNSGSFNESTHLGKGSDLETTNIVDGFESDQINTVSSTSDAKKGKRKEETPNMTGDIRKVVRKDATDIPEAKNMKKDNLGKGIIKRKKDNEHLNEFTKSKWDSPDDFNTSPHIKHSSPYVKQTHKDSRDSHRQSSSKGSDSSNKRNKRSNSREFEGIRIHITNDKFKFGKPAEIKSDLGVVEMFHVNQTHEQTTQSENAFSKTTEENVIPRLSSGKHQQSELLQNVKTILKSDSLKQNETNKSRIYRQRNRSPNRPKSRSRSRGRRSRSPVHNRKPRTGTGPVQRRSRSPVHRRSRSPVNRGKPRSPVHRGKPRSPVRRGRSRSPVRRGRPRSPVRRGRSRSPIRRSRSRSPVKRRSFSKSPQRRNIARANKTSRPIIRGRNKFTDSRSPSLSPGRKYSEGLTSNKRSYNAGGRDNSGRDRSRRSSSKSRGRIQSRSQTGRRSRSKSHNRGQGNNRENNEKSKRTNNGKTEENTMDDLENFFSKLKENKKKQTDVK